MSFNKLLISGNTGEKLIVTSVTGSNLKTPMGAFE